MQVLPLYLPPVLVPAFLAWIFGQTLLPGRTPLIERLVLVLHGPDTVPEDGVLAYARHLTQAWAVLFIGLAGDESAAGHLRRAGGVVAVREPDRLCDRPGVLRSPNTRIRRRRFPQQPYRNMLEFVQRVLANWPAWSDARRDEQSCRASRDRAHSRGLIRRCPAIFPGGRSCRASCCCNVCWTKPNAGSAKKLSVRGLPQAKFSTPLLPEQEAELELRLTQLRAALQRKA
jgi:hypothetical protein